MRKETTSSAKAPAMPKTSEKKATPKKAVIANDVYAVTPSEVTNHQNELPVCHALT